MDEVNAIRVLSVGEDADRSDRVRTQLAESYPFEVTVLGASSRAEALSVLVDRGPFDVALVDIDLPDCHGTDIVEDIVAHSPNTATVAVTTPGDRTAVSLALRRGATWFVSRVEADGPELVDAIEHAIDRKRFEAELQTRANTDPLTGLLNRFALVTRYPMASSVARRAGRRIAVVALDLNGFKAINDSSGHHAGDRVLQEVAARLRHGAREGDLVVRTGGDEFVIVGGELGANDDDRALRTFAERVRRTVNEPPIIVDGNRVTTAVGAVAAHGAEELDELLRAADQAMYADKGSARRR